MSCALRNAQSVEEAQVAQVFRYGPVELVSLKPPVDKEARGPRRATMVSSQNKARRLQESSRKRHKKEELRERRPRTAAEAR